MLSDGCSMITQRMSLGDRGRGTSIMGGALEQSSWNDDGPEGPDILEALTALKIPPLPSLCLIANMDVNIKYGAAAGVSASIGVAEVGAEFDVGSLNVGSRGFSLTQGYSVGGGLNIPLIGSAFFGCQAERRIAWSSYTESGDCGLQHSASASVGSEGGRGRVGVGFTFGVGVSASVDLAGFGKCVIGK